jgi:hypothetical protein
MDLNQYLHIREDPPPILRMNFCVECSITMKTLVAEQLRDRFVDNNSPSRYKTIFHWQSINMDIFCL